MELYAFFHRKDEEIRSQHCVVEKVLELSERVCPLLSITAGGV